MNGHADNCASMHMTSFCGVLVQLACTCGYHAWCERVAKAGRECVKHARGRSGGSVYMIDRKDFLALKSAVRGDARQEAGE